METVEERERRKEVKKIKRPTTYHSQTRITLIIPTKERRLQPNTSS